jgi:tetratricopeptide (TPR) repeat protein
MLARARILRLATAVGLIHAQGTVWVEYTREGYRLRAQGRLLESQRAFMRANDSATAALGTKHPMAAVTLHNLGVAYVGLGKLTQAEKCLRESLTVLESALGSEDPLVAQNLSSLGMLYHRLHRYRAAMPLQERALALREKVGSSDVSVAVALNDLAATRVELGEYS